MERVSDLVFGKPKDPLDSNVFHKLSLIAFLAWVGLGADGLSSSAYGPEETYKALGGQYHHIALYLALAVAATVFIISASYSQIIEHFPSGGGGYVVASKLLHPVAGLISGSALIVDYILTINISIAAGVDAIGDFMPGAFVAHKLAVEVLLVLLLIWLNMRGIKESVTTLLPIFILFVITHIVLIVAGLIGHGSQIMPVVRSTFLETHQIVGGPLGAWGFLVIFFTAYSLGGGTYTGMEAVSNGLQNLREPRVQTGKSTMLYMATSLSLAAGGILVLYMLWDTPAVKDETMNGTLSKQIFGPWTLFRLPVGQWLITLTLLSEGMLLFIAAQTDTFEGELRQYLFPLKPNDEEWPGQVNHYNLIQRSRLALASVYQTQDPQALKLQMEALTQVYNKYILMPQFIKMLWPIVEGPAEGPAKSFKVFRKDPPYLYFGKGRNFKAGRECLW